LKKEKITNCFEITTCLPCTWYFYYNEVW